MQTIKYLPLYEHLMVTLNFRTIAIPLLVVASHALAHTFLADKIMGILNPLLTTLVVMVTYYALRITFRRAGKEKLSKKALKTEQMQDKLFPVLVGVFHMIAHLASSYLLGIPIIDNTVIGIAGTVVLGFTAFYEIVW